MPINGSSANPPKEECINQVCRIFEGKSSVSDVVPFNNVNKYKNYRSPFYKSFDVYFHKNTSQSAGYLVCSYARNGGCKLGNAINKFNAQNGGTNRLERHAANHASIDVSPAFNFPRPMSDSLKGNIGKAAALAVALDLRPVSFTDGKKGMTLFSNAVFQAGQSTPVSDTITPGSIMPCARTVTKHVHDLANIYRQRFENLYLNGMLAAGGGATKDGLTLKVQEKQFYDFTVHFLKIVTKSGVSSGTPVVTMHAKTLLLSERLGDGSGASIRHLRDTGLRKHYNTDTDTFTNTFTLFTDCAANMARGALFSVSRTTRDDAKWLGCLSHETNTAMKTCVSALQNHIECSQIYRDLQYVKTIVRIFKQSGWNSRLPTGFHLIRDVETRFASTYAVAERFLKTAGFLRNRVISQDSDSLTAAFRSLTKETNQDGEVFGFPCIEGICDTFEFVFEAQKRLKRSTQRLFTLLFPCYRSVKMSLRESQAMILFYEEVAAALLLRLCFRARWLP